MSLESFYGGKQGISPVIKNSFEFIDENDFAYQAALEAGKTATELLPFTMDLCFANSNYKDVWYDELCIIDTINKNNPNNGKIFKRTLKGAGDTGENLCAEYVGRIVGPAGTNPFLSFGSLSSVAAQGTTNKIDLAPEMQVSYPIDENGTVSSAKTEIIDNQEIQINIIPVNQSANIDNNMLVPGKDELGNFNDDIKYTWLNVVDDTREIPTRSIVYMGFQIPYPSLEVYSTTTDWWNNVEINKRGTEHPFYHAWDLTVPRGVRGNAATNIRLAQQKEFNNIPGGTENKPTLYDFERDLINNGVGVYTIRSLVDENDHYGPDLPAYIEGIEESYIWVYDYIFYDINGYDDDETSEEIELTKTYTFYIGLYNEISNVTLNDDGTIIFHHSNTTKNIFDRKLSWINDVSITPSGILSFTYNQDKYYQRSNDTTPNTNKRYYILDENNNYILQENITQFNPEVIYYEGSNIYSKQLPYPTSIITNNDGTITLNLADQSPLTLKKSGSSENYKLDYVNSISMDNNTKVLSYKKSAAVSGNNPYPSYPLNNSKGINYIEVMTIDDKYHLLIYYASNQYRPPSSSIPGTIEWHGLNFRNNFPYSNDNVTISANEYWLDLGSVLEKSAGVKVFTEINWEDHPDYDPSPQSISTISPEDFIATVLNPRYWDNPNNTIENPYYEGNIPGDDPYTNYRGTFIFSRDVSGGSLFFYDYDAETWVHAGSMSTSQDVDIMIQLNTGNYANTSQNLTDYGIILRERTNVNSLSLLPDFGI